MEDIPGHKRIEEMFFEPSLQSLHIYKPKLLSDRSITCKVLNLKQLNKRLLNPNNKSNHRLDRKPHSKRTR